MKTLIFNKNKFHIFLDFLDGKSDKETETKYVQK